MEGEAEGWERAEIQGWCARPGVPCLYTRVGEDRMKSQSQQLLHGGEVGKSSPEEEGRRTSIKCGCAPR